MHFHLFIFLAVNQNIVMLYVYNFYSSFIDLLFVKLTSTLQDITPFHYLSQPARFNL
jgi:hypothetical protein